MTKLDHGRKFLQDGAKLKVTLMFRGREMARVDLGKLVMEKVLKNCQMWRKLKRIFL